MVKKPVMTTAINERERYLNRKSVLFDKNGWANAEEYKPLDFELVQVEDDKGKRQMGWWSGFEWDFGRKWISGQVKFWRTYFDKSDRMNFK